MMKSYIKECAELPLQYLPGASVLNKEVMNLMIMMTMLATKSAIADMVHMPHDDDMMLMMIPGLVFEVQGPCSAS